jgi:hypothetical protein
MPQWMAVPAGGDSGLASSHYKAKGLPRMCGRPLLEVFGF